MKKIIASDCDLYKCPFFSMTINDRFNQQDSVCTITKTVIESDENMNYKPIRPSDCQLKKERIVVELILEGDKNV